MEIKQQDIENCELSVQEEMRGPLVPQDKKRAAENGAADEKPSHGEDRGMVYLSTFVAVCGSFAMGSCAGYSSPTQFAITNELNLSTAEYSLFGSILTIGAMLGAITSGRIADVFGRKEDG